MARSRRPKNKKITASTSDVSSTDETASSVPVDGSSSVVSSSSSIGSDVPEQHTYYQRKGGRKYKRTSSAVSNRDSFLLKKYLHEYRDCVYKFYNQSSSLLPYYLSRRQYDTNNKNNSFMDSTDPIILFDVEFPRFDSNEILERPYLALPKELKGRDRRTIHSVCEEIELFHCGVGSNPNERYVAVSIFRDGLSYVPGIDEVSILPVDRCKPWIKKKNIDRDVMTNKAKELIYQLIDQPGQCLRDEIDYIDLPKMLEDDLSNTIPPKQEDDNWLFVDTIEKMQQCINELQQNKPTELAFDLECYNRAKMQQMTCLIQLATDDGREYVIDVLADGVWDTVGGLGPIFADNGVVKIGHGVDGVDIQSLHRDFGILVVNIFDTIEAAKTLRLKEKGLAKICDYYNLPNCEIYTMLKEKYQNTDWTRRPLTDPMVLYGRYDVHYLIKLRKLLMRDLIKPEGNVQVEFDNGDAEMAAFIRACNEEDGIEDDYSPLNLDDFPHDDDDELQTTELDDGDNNKTLFHAKDLRLNLSLMQVISSSQDKCLTIWKDKPEDYFKDSGYITLITNSKKAGNGWTLNQVELYKQLAQWRESVATKEEVLSGFVCGLEFLAKVAWIRPRNQCDLQQICYHLPPILEQNEGLYLNEIFAMVEQSCLNDTITKQKIFPSYKEWKEQQQSLLVWNNWIGIASGIAVATATMAFIKLRNR